MGTRPQDFYTGPWHARIAITFILVNIFTRGFLQRFKHRLGLLWFSHNPMHKIVEKCRSVGGRESGRVGIPYNSTFRYLSQNTLRADMPTPRKSYRDDRTVTNRTILR